MTAYCIIEYQERIGEVFVHGPFPDRTAAFTNAKFFADIEFVLSKDQDPDNDWEVCGADDESEVWVQYKWVIDGDDGIEVTYRLEVKELLPPTT